MKNISRLLAILLTLCMLLAVGAFASAEPASDEAASGEASGEAGSGEASSGEPSAESGKSVEEAFVEYIHEWLLAELEVNSQMTIEQVEDEFMPLVEQMNFTDFPAEMIYSGMLEQGVPMTFEEFSAQYVPEGGDGYTADEEGYKAYLKDWLSANPAVQANIDEFFALIDAGDYASFPMDMLFTDQWFGFAALSLDEFIAAGGAAEIPAFDPNLAPD